MEKITAETMRSYNRRQIFNHIYFNKRSSRQEIADTLHLSLTTVTQNLKMLEEENLIERSGYFQSTGCLLYTSPDGRRQDRAGQDAGRDAL